MATWFFTSDLHGQSDLYEQVFSLALEREPSALLIGGDLGPHAGSESGVRRQRLWLEGFLVEFARRLHEAVPGCTLALLMGNDDWAANVDVLERHHGTLWQHLHERVITIDGVAVVGMSYVPITPFGIKDWERWEDGEDESPSQLHGYRSDASGAVHAFAFDPARRRPTLRDALEQLASQCVPHDSVFVLHSPPHGTACDMIGTRTHVGSRAIRAFIEQHQPRLTLSGHIHESARVSGSWRDTVGATVCVNPGQFGQARACGVWFDPTGPAGSLAHTVHG